MAIALIATHSSRKTNEEKFIIFREDSYSFEFFERVDKRLIDKIRKLCTVESRCEGQSIEFF